METEISGKGFAIWDIDTIYGVEVKKEVLRIVREGNDTIANFAGISDGTSTLRVDNLIAKNTNFEGGGLTGVLKFKQILGVDEDGTSNKWATATLEFKHGILVKGSWADME